MFDTYRETVLDPARAAGNTPPADLFVRYDLDPRSAGDPEEFTRRVEEIVKYWRKLKLQKKYGALATALLAADTDLRRKGLLNLEAFTKRREESRGDAHSRLNEEIAVIAAARPCITPAGLRRLIASMDNLFSEQEIREALGQHNVRVIDPPWDLPAGPPIPAVRSLRAPLTALGFKLSPEALFGTEAVRKGFTLRNGFRLADGRTITTAALQQARAEQARSKQDERKTAMDNVIAILINAATQANNLDALLLWEIREQLRPAIEAGETDRLVALQATRLGLDEGEAIELAVTLAGQSGEVKRGDDSARRVADALRDGELREAQRLLDALPSGDCAEQRAQLDEALRRVADLVTRAEDALRQGDGELAAGLFAAAAEVARDDDGLEARLAEIPPPPPGEVTAGVDGDRVVVRWTPSQARTPGVRYRVVRSDGTPAVSSTAGTGVTETQANEAVDELPPPATPLHYTVFASRGETWSVGASAPVLEVTPEVRDVVLSADEGVVSGTWQAHPDATEVIVTRADRTGSAERRIRVAAATFTDTDVVSGETYDYTFRAVFLSRTGERRMSPPVVVSARPDAKPVAVTDLVHEVRHEHGKAVLVVAWRPPPSGVVELRTSQSAPPWPVGSLVSRAEAQAFGQPAGGIAAPGDDGRVRQALSVRSGRLTVTAVTVSGDHAAIGETVTQSLVAPVTGVKAERFGDLVRVRWVWPDGATAVRVRWWPSEEDDTPLHVEELDISARVHTDSGGAEISAGPGATTVALQTVMRDRNTDSVSATVLTRISGRPANVGYTVRLAGLPGRRRLDLTLTSDRACRVPAIVVVHRTDGVIPLRADRGRVIATLPPRNLTAGVPVTVSLPERVSPLSGLACFPDPGSTTADEVTLVPRTAR
ncbi:hypothetical protein [Lentzea flava]|uniref:Fibronectin type-III domain-containing protein n=1 Tax=Lentzea flava TaxID=103732 RepID=A0ABQ2UZW3_9PSEU|nr:hypothetical protein [Lentzea flava]MCP2202455.1 hypothetical protein [Lentzea flava]GGU59190.1 hypothetical protein GCM10010178_59290 [Lentzea flava]